MTSNQIKYNLIGQFFRTGHKKRKQPSTRVVFCFTFISYPAGLSHSKRKILKAEICTAARPTRSQEAASKGSEKNNI